MWWWWTLVVLIILVIAVAFGLGGRRAGGRDTGMQQENAHHGATSPARRP